MTIAVIHVTGLLKREKRVISELGRFKNPGKKREYDYNQAENTDDFF